jgi:hypothetical protein
MKAYPVQQIFCKLFNHTLHENPFHSLCCVCTDRQTTSMILTGDAQEGKHSETDFT